MTTNIPPATVTRLHSVRPRSIPPALPRVLFVDDEELVARAFRRSMRRRGFDVTVASSAAEALEIASSAEFDVLVTDLSMPGMDGVALIDKLVERGDDMAYVVATGHGELYVRGEYQLTGLDIHIVDKPWKDADVAELLHRLASERDAGAAQVG